MRHFYIFLCIFCCGNVLAAVDLDSQSIFDAPELSYLASCLVAADGVTAKRLTDFRYLKFSCAPDPSELMIEMSRVNHLKRVEKSIKVNVLSFNVALLDAQILSVISVIKSPYLEERRMFLPKLIFDMGYDVVMLQELFRKSRQPFVERAKKQGYKAFYSNIGSDDGLSIFVKKSMLTDSQIRLQRRIFDEQDPKENYPGAEVERGFIHVSIKSSELGRLHLVNTHLQSFRKYWRKRNYQARQLGLYLDRSLEKRDVAIVAGDLNVGPYFKMDHWRNHAGKVTKSWWKNATAYGLLLHYGRLKDAMVMALPPHDANLDVKLGDEVDYGILNCDYDGELSFTATDCNSLNYLQYAGKEPPSRQDHILLRDLSGRARVIERKVVLTKKMDIGLNVAIEPSDHYGVSAVFEIEKQKHIGY